MAQRVILFDVNETLLDMSVLDQPFERIFGERSARADWFKQLLQLSLLTNVLDSYTDFSALARAALEMVAEQRKTAVSDDQMRDVAQAMRALPAHEDVAAGFSPPSGCRLSPGDPHEFHRGSGGGAAAVRRYSRLLRGRTFGRPRSALQAGPGERTAWLRSASASRSRRYAWSPHTVGTCGARCTPALQPHSLRG
jgi:hypothetical protein